MAEYYGNVDYNQGYSGYAGAPGATFPPAAGTTGPTQQWSQAAPSGVPAGYPTGAPPEAHYQAYPPSQYGQAPPPANPVAVPPAAAYNGASPYGAQPAAGPYGQPVPPPGAAGGNGYGVPPPISPASGPIYGGPGGPPGGYASRSGPGGYPDEVSGRPNFRGPSGNGRAPGPVFNKGYGGRGGYGGMEEQNDTVFVSGLPEDTTEVQLADYFGSIGIVKMDKKTGKHKVWIYRDKASGKPKGEATVTFDDPPTANSAIDWFNGKEFFGSTIKVELAQRKSNNFGANRGGFGDRDGGSRGDRGGERGGERGGREGRFERDNRTSVREGDWICPNDECNNNNFAWRTECNRCKTAKPEDADGEAPRRGGGPPPFGAERRGPGGRPPMGGGSGFRGGYSPRGPSRNGGPPSGGYDRPRGPSGGPRGPREGGRGGPMRGSDNRRAAPY